MYKDLRNLLLLFAFLLSLFVNAGQNSNNLVLYFDANNSSSYNGSGNIINDLSSSNNDLKMMGGVTFVNSSNDIPHFNFDGNGDYLKINSAPFANSPNGLSNYTIITKLKIPSNNSASYIMTMGRSSSFFNSEFIFYQRTNGKAGFWDYHNGLGFRDNSTSQSNAVLDDNTWKHVAFVKSGTVGKFYINGALDATVNAAKNVTSLNSQFFYIGGDVRDSNDWLNGKIAYAKLYTTALSASDILSDYNNSNAVLFNPPSYISTSALKAYYPFDGNANDQSGNGYHASVDNYSYTPSFSTDRKVGTKSLDLDGMDDHLKLGSSHFFDLGSYGSKPGMTVSFWLKPLEPSVGSVQILTSPKGQQFQFNYSKNTNKVTFNSKPSNQWEGAAASVNTSSQWEHFTGVYEVDSSTGNHLMKMFKNGVLIETNNLGSSPSHTTDDSHPTPTLGAIKTGGTGSPIEVYKGGIDELVIWQRSLAATEVFSLYRNQNGNPDTTAPTLSSLVHSANDNFVIPNADSVTITATFNEDMADAPKIHIDGLVSNAAMTPSGNSKTVWRYTWNVGAMPTSGQTTITVSGTDMSGNAYVPGNQLISFSTRPLPNYLPSGQLLAWYPFNSDASDESGNGKNGVVKNGSSPSPPPQLTTDRFGNANSAYDFESTGASFSNDWQRIDLPSFSLTSSFTVNAWINPESYFWTGNNTRVAMIMANNAGGNCANQFFRFNIGTDQIQTNTGRLYGAAPHSGGNAEANSATGTIDLNSWQMVTMMGDGSKISVYKNGQKVAESSSVSGISYNSCLTIGLHHQTNGQWYYFDGKIDDVAIWDRSLSSAELNQLYTGQVAPDYEGPNIFNITVSPTTVDVTTSNQVITVSYQATDTTGVDTSYSYRNQFIFFW